MIAYDPRGAVFALTDGAELLLHDGPSEGPLWRKTLDGDIVAVATDGQQVVVVTAAGTVHWFAARGGPSQRTASFDRPLTAAAIAPELDRVVAASASQVLVLEGREVRTLAEHGGQVVASGPARSLAVGHGQELLIFGASGQRSATTLEGRITAIAHHPDGFWMVGVNHRVFRHDGQALAHVTNLPAGSVVSGLACIKTAFAVAWDDRAVGVLAWPSRDTLGNLSYPERKARGIAFGPWPWLLVGMDLGDGNKLNFITGAVHRSDTHQGRPHNRWLVMSGVESSTHATPPPAPPVPARPAPAPPARSSLGVVGAVIAVIVAVVVFILLRR